MFIANNNNNNKCCVILLISMMSLRIKICFRRILLWVFFKKRKDFLWLRHRTVVSYLIKQNICTFFLKKKIEKSKNKMNISCCCFLCVDLISCFWKDCCACLVFGHIETNYSITFRSNGRPDVGREEGVMRHSKI